MVIWFIIDIIYMCIKLIDLKFISKCIFINIFKLYLSFKPYLSEVELEFNGKTDECLYLKNIFNN